MGLILLEFLGCIARGFYNSGWSGICLVSLCLASLSACEWGCERCFLVEIGCFWVLSYRFICIFRLLIGVVYVYVGVESCSVEVLAGCKRSSESEVVQMLWIIEALTLFRRIWCWSYSVVGGYNWFWFAGFEYDMKSLVSNLFKFRDICRILRLGCFVFMWWVRSLCFGYCLFRLFRIWCCLKPFRAKCTNFEWC